MDGERKVCTSYLIVRDGDGGRRVAYASPEACQTLGRTAGELDGADPEPLLAGRGVTEVPLPEGGTLLLLAGDKLMDELRQMNFDLEQALQAANAANEAKSSFLSNMSHDIRTPMNAIMGMTNIAQNHLDEKNRVQDCLNKIQTASAHLMSLINDVLDMSRIDSGRATISEEQFSLADLVHDLTVMLSPMAAAKQQELLWDVSDIAQEELMGDVLYLRQIYVNIISNAVKYTQDEGTIQVRFSQRPGAEPRQIMLDFSCQDNGIGMSADFVKRIFLPFERAQNTTVAKIEGTGLGTTIVRSLVEQMGGTVEVESELGVGTVFRVSLPLSVSKLGEDTTPLLGWTVLVVEPEPEQSDLVVRFLEQGGGKAVALRTGAEVVTWITQAMFEGTPPDSVLLSGNLGESAVLDLATHIRGQLGSQTPILLFSDEDWSRIEYAAHRAGITGFVPCPIFKGRLFQALCQQQESDEAWPRGNFSGLHILLAEDNALNREIALELIGETGAQVDPVEDGKQALEAFTSSEPGYYDLILMDVQMPVMDGYEAVRRIRALSRDDAKSVCIAAMTANAFVEDIKKSRAAGMDEHLSKPVDIRRIEELMRRCQQEDT